MHRAPVLVGLFLAAAAGFAAGRSASPSPRITGIGGVFFKSKHPKELRAWYETHFGFVPRPDDLDGFCRKLEAEGIKIEGRDAAGYGKFAWVRDSDGNKVELWEPQVSR